jgi:hypothetical protein
MNSTYSIVVKPRLIDASRVSYLFGKPPTWFNRDRVRKALYARGFPAPVVRGRWLGSAVDSWLAREGSRQTNPREGRRSGLANAGKQTF